MENSSIGMTWPVLNNALVATEDERLLLRWLNTEVAAGQPRYRILRIYYRLAAVRRRRELNELHRGKWRAGEEVVA